MAEDIVRNLLSVKKDKPEEANYTYGIKEFQISEIPLLSNIDEQPTFFETDLKIKRTISFNFIWDADNQKWIKATGLGGDRGNTGAISKNPILINISIPTATWTKIADLPNNVNSWAIKSTDNNFIFRLNFSGAGNFLTINSGITWVEDTNPAEIWVWHNQGINKDFELLYWTP